MIHQTLSLTDEEERTFYNRALDSELKQIITDLKIQLNECSHNLIEIERQIIDYLNRSTCKGIPRETQKVKISERPFYFRGGNEYQANSESENEVLFENVCRNLYIYR